MNKAYKEAVAAVGSISELARQLKTSRQVVQHWKRNGIPPEWVLSVEKVTGVSRYELREDIYGKTMP
jgi:DNA-binding transcriptional regulator YdaS (Cro superfamily)